MKKLFLNLIASLTSHKKHKMNENRDMSSVNIDSNNIPDEAIYSSKQGIPQIKGERNKIIIWNNGISTELNINEGINGFSEITIEGDDNVIELEYPLCAKGELLENNILRIYGNKHYVKIDSTFKLHDNQFALYLDGSSLTIGKNSSLRHTVILSSDNSHIEIGKECMIAEAQIRGADFHAVYDIETNKVLNIPNKPLIIGNRVWLGERCRILKNAQIADGCIVGAESVVAKCFLEQNCAIAGNPARVIKTGVTWDRKGPLFFENEGKWIY